MEQIGGYARTGRQLLGPGSDLVEVQGADGGRFTAVVFHPEYRAHNAINAALHVVYGFLESPMVPGLAELVRHDREQAAFLYNTGQVWSVAEVIRTLSDLGEGGGPRAGVELLLQTGTILVEAAEIGESAGVYSHGGLTPWRVMLDGEGRVNLIGYALPQVEILVFHDEPGRIPREDAFRYCPPERMDARRENFTSDLFGLGLICFELMTGRPVYDGLINEIRTKAARGETSRRLQQFKDALPASVREVLTTTLRPELRDRFGSGQEFIDAVAAVTRDPSLDGPSLRDVMARVARHQPRARQELDPGRTSMLSKDELRRLAADDGPPSAGTSGRQAFAAPPRAAAVASSRAAPSPVPAPLAAPAALVAPVSDVGPCAPAAPVEILVSSAGGTGLPAGRRPPRLAGASDVAPPPPAPPRVATSVPTRGRAAPPLEVPPPQAAPPAAERPATPFGAARLPPGRRPTPATPAAPAPTDPTSMLEEILSQSGGGGVAEVRDRVERAMRASGSGSIATASVTTPAPVLIPTPSAPASALGGFVPVDGDTASVTVGVAAAASRSLPPPPPPPPPAADGEDDADHPTGPSASGPRPVATPPPAPPAPRPPPSLAPIPLPPRTPTPVDSVGPVRRVPVQVRQAPRGEPVAVRFARAPGVRGHRQRLPGDTTLAQAAHQLVGVLVPLRCAPDGTLLGWYRLGNELGPLPVDLTVGELDDEETCSLHFVENRTVWRSIEVDGHSVRQVIGLAVPIVSLVDAFAMQFGLADEPWQLWLDGVVLDDFHILADHELTEASRLAIRRGGAG
ncbi:MAG: hypothetical protein EXR71_00155 [Myxococcales bacterium]|nr:hypothetical protein [Myxococcales bacterium]